MAKKPAKALPSMSVSSFGGGSPLSKLEGDLAGHSIQVRALELDDEFSGMYDSGTEETRVLPPPYPLKTLEMLVENNNALGPCIDAMETNIDGTGHQVLHKDDLKEEEYTSEQKKKHAKVSGFFDEPWPGISFPTMRRLLRRDLESSGNGYLEVLRNRRGDLAFLRGVIAHGVRLVKLGEPVMAQKKVVRGGEAVSYSVHTRERTFIQVIGTRKVYFKEYGASRDLSRTTGKWGTEAVPIKEADKATELLHFKLTPHPLTPYGVPRWIGQLPSVLGSRKAEEHNLEFFDSGGVPPILILIQGGELGEKEKEALEQHFSGRSKNKQRAVVISAAPTGGSLEHDSPTPKVTIERFGSERQQDGMFSKYDEQAERKVRRAFRLPAIFLGMSQEYSFATAFVSYTVAEAQVFGLERGEFDEILNMTIVRELDPTGEFKLKSNPLSIKDVAMQLKAVDMVSRASLADMDSVIENVNHIVGTTLKPSDTNPNEPLISPIQDNNGPIHTPTTSSEPTPTAPPKASDAAKSEVTEVVKGGEVKSVAPGDHNGVPASEKV